MRRMMKGNQLRKSYQVCKQALYEAVNLIESFALFQSDDLAKQLRKHTAQFNDEVASSSREDKSTINTFFKPI